MLASEAPSWHSRLPALPACSRDPPTPTIKVSLGKVRDL